LVLLLESWGMSVLEAGSGEEALALIDELGILPDLCLVDHQLGDGLTGIAAIRALWARHGTIPARLITANRSQDVQDQARAAGIAVLMKPIDARALQGFIAQVGAQATTMV
jgi:CheY-like chemotaxis protein